MQATDPPVNVELDSQGMSQIQTQTQTQTQSQSEEWITDTEVNMMERAWARLYRQQLPEDSPGALTRRALGCGPRPPKTKNTPRHSPPQLQINEARSPSPVPYIELVSSEFKVGRARTCCFVVTDSHISHDVLKNISKEHFMIYRDVSDSHCPAILEDLSHNGTFVNGQKIGKGNKMILENDDRIAVTLPNRILFIFMDLFTNEQDQVSKVISDKYYVSKILGTGACGVVKLVYNKMTCEKFAMKIVTKKHLINGQKHALNDPKKIMNEVNILKALKHVSGYKLVLRMDICIAQAKLVNPLAFRESPNVYGHLQLPLVYVKTEEVFDTPEAVYIILELMDEGELFDYISRVGRLPERSAKTVFRQMVLAVQYLHDNGITHRDLKPENILLGNTELGNTLVKLTDFGLSKFVNEESFMKTMCGTPLYVAPEVLLAEGKQTYNSQVDVWSLGVILFICLAGYLPFSHEYKDLSLREQIIGGRFKYSRTHWEGIGVAAKKLVTKLLTVDPKVRITIDGILSDPWMQDELVINRVQELFVEVPIDKNILTVNQSTNINPVSPSMKRQLSEIQRLHDPSPKRRKVLTESGNVTMVVPGTSSEDTDEETPTLIEQN